MMKLSSILSIAVAAILALAALAIFGSMLPSIGASAVTEDAAVDQFQDIQAISTVTPAPFIPTPVVASASISTVTLHVDGGYVVMTIEDFARYNKQVYEHNEKMSQMALDAVVGVAQSGDQAQSIQAGASAISGMGMGCMLLALVVVMVAVVGYVLVRGGG